MKQCVCGSRTSTFVWGVLAVMAVFIPMTSLFAGGTSEATVDTQKSDVLTLLPEAYRTGAAYDYRFILRDESNAIGLEMLNFDIDALVKKIVAEALSSQTALQATTDPIVDDQSAVEPHDHFGEIWSGADSIGLRVNNSQEAGHGLMGYASSTTGITRGVWGWAESNEGIGLYGYASSPTGYTFGLLGYAESPNGRGLGGIANATTGTAYGVYGRSSASGGTGIHGRATSATGTTYGVYGTATSADGYGLYTPDRAYVGGQLVTSSLGTTDDTALEIKVNSVRALRLEPHAVSPNILAGSSANSLESGCYGATIAGGGGASGTQNRLYDNYCSIGGGSNNTCGSDDSNTTTAAYATVAGGWSNQALELYATVSGGLQNAAAENAATVGGGNANEANGQYATVPGGHSNSADGNYSFAAGRRAIATNAGSFAWADSTDADYEVAVDNRFGARASGGFYLHTNAAASSGAYLAAGSGTWADLSDRNKKTNIVSVDPQDVLAKVAVLPVSSWNYKTEDASIRHMGPMAQDMHAAFGLGDSDKSICTIDADGVALASIKGLHQLIQEKDAEIASLNERVARLEAAINAMLDK